MPKYNVTVHAKWHVWTNIEVEAASEELAKAMAVATAEDQLNGSTNQEDWTLDEEGIDPGSCVADEDVASADCSCETDGKGCGWLHMTDSCGRGPGIERCDSCAKFATDDEAAEAHARECNCGLGLAKEEEE